ncbi:hypothetical protein [Schnuerera sp.]|uniref:hypothetical protein n=1 Tax=Schnuerera sp. TaxID=2794844 RepID=UPI002C330F9E|nr:hypothetical protein [Schnuerera sp.]HSH37063.1 hypothetical protein [Schnuerera sp.]
MAINSHEESILFCLGPERDIEYRLFNDFNTLIDKLQLNKNKVLKYSIAIDNMDKIHLVALMNSGELNYFIYDNGNWSNTIIAKFDLQSKVYGDIYIFGEENNINIIYSYANLINSKLWTIQHVIGYNNTWNQYSVIKFASHRNSAAYVIDKDTLGNIQLLYGSIEDYTSQIYHTFYNFYAKIWNPSPSKLTTSKINKVSPYIFVDTKNHIHSLWLESLDNNHILKYSKLNTLDGKKYIWKQIKIPYISDCYNYPIMFEENNLLKIAYIKSDTIGYLYSADYGDTWYEGDSFNTDFSNINLIKVSKHDSAYKNIKVNHIYALLEEKLNFLFLDSINSSNVAYSNLKKDYEKSSLENNKLEEIETKIENILNNQETINDLLLKNIDSQKRVEVNIQSLIDILSNKKNSLFEKLFKW